MYDCTHLTIFYKRGDIIGSKSCIESFIGLSKVPPRNGTTNYERMGKSTTSNN